MKRWVPGAICAGAMVLGAHGAAAQDTTFKVFWKDGIRMETADGNFKLKLGGRIQYDAAFLGSDSDLEDAVGSFKDETELRRARLELEGLIYERFVFKSQYEFVGSKANVKDMYIGINGLPFLGDLKLGQVKEAFSIEELTSSKYDEFMEQGLSTIFAPSRNPGVSFLNSVLDERMTYAAGVFVDGDDGGNSDNKEVYAVTGRLTGLPWYAAENQLLHVGFNASYRNAKKSIQIRQRPESHVAPYVVDTGELPADSQMVFGPEVAFVYGPFCLQGEWDMSAVNSKTGGDPNFSGYYVYASYWLTGESRTYKPTEGDFERVKPKRNLFQAGGLGAWELLVRYSSLDLNDADVHGGKVSDVTAGLNWEWNPNMRMMFNYVYSDTKDLGSASIFQTRVQADF